MDDWTGGRAVVELLKAEGVRHIFGIVGSTFLDVLDRLYDDRSVEYINVRHEQAAAFMADGADRTETGYRGNATVRSTFDGDRLVITHTRTKTSDQGTQTRTRESVWTLSPDGRVLTIDTTMHSPRGDHAMKTVYQKS